MKQLIMSGKDRQAVVSMMTVLVAVGVIGIEEFMEVTIGLDELRALSETDSDSFLQLLAEFHLMVR